MDPSLTLSPHRGGLVSRTGIVVASYLVAGTLAALVAHPTRLAALRPTALVLAAVAGLVGAATVAPVARRLRLPLASRLVVVTLLGCLLSSASNEVEAVLFIKDANPLLPAGGLIVALGLAVPVVLLFPPTDTDDRVAAALRDTLASRPWWSWVWRIGLLAILWVPVYLAFAAADAPFVHRYYAQTGGSFHVPGTGVVLAAELARGVLHALVFGALAALLRRTRVRAWLWLALAFATYNAWLPLIGRNDWPWFLRAANAVEITCDAVVFGGLAALLVVRRARARPGAA